MKLNKEVLFKGLTWRFAVVNSIPAAVGAFIAQHLIRTAQNMYDVILWIPLIPIGVFFTYVFVAYLIDYTGDN